MGTFRNPVFIICAALFMLNRLLEWQGVFIALLPSYLDDLLCLPVTLTIILAVERLYFKLPAFIMPVKYSWWAIIAFSVVFEGVLPLLSDRYTADVLDVFFYSLGALIFILTINKPLPQCAAKAL
jgi:hypothetical protein